MRRFTALALLHLILLAPSALAQSGLDDIGSEQQTEGYGKLFGYVCGAVAAIGLIFGAIQIAKGIAAEHRRGRKVKAITDILDEDEVKKKRRDPALRIGEKVPEWKI